MCKKLITALIEQPFLASIFITDFVILAFHKPPFIFSVVMLGGLAAMCMYYGQKLAPFKMSEEKAAE